MEQVTARTARLSIGPSEETHGSFTYRVDPTATLSITGPDSEVRHYRLKGGSAGRTKNGSEQRAGRNHEHKHVGVQGPNVRVDRDQPTGRDRVGAAEGTGVQHGPVSTRAVRSVSQVRCGRNAAGTEVDTVEGGSPRAHATPATGAPRFVYNTHRRKWTCEET